MNVVVVHRTAKWQAEILATGMAPVDAFATANGTWGLADPVRLNETELLVIKTGGGLILHVARVLGWARVPDRLLHPGDENAGIQFATLPTVSPEALALIGTFVPPSLRCRPPRYATVTDGEWSPR